MKIAQAIANELLSTFFQKSRLTGRGMHPTIRKADVEDAGILSVLATEVWLDTYATKDSHRAGTTIKAALSSMYQQGRFLGGFEWVGQYGIYVDRSEGDASHFHGRETIVVEGKEAYALDYFGGLIKP